MLDSFQGLSDRADVLELFVPVSVLSDIEPVNRVPELVYCVLNVPVELVFDLVALLLDFQVFYVSIFVIEIL